MDRTAFVAAYGGIIEHSPWIAERAFDAGGMAGAPGVDTVHTALVAAFRAASPDEHLAVLKAHPDLAGKLAVARRLTDSSAAEQASAGLDALTDGERARFEDLNARYTAKFGFPFIIAVRDHDKSGILEAFERRLDNDRDAELREACRQVERIAQLRLIVQSESRDR